jgi:hypothetical protein
VLIGPDVHQDARFDEHGSPRRRHLFFCEDAFGALVLLCAGVAAGLRIADVAARLRETGARAGDDEKERRKGSLHAGLLQI